MMNDKKNNDVETMETEAIKEEAVEQEVQEEVKEESNQAHGHGGKHKNGQSCGNHEKGEKGCCGEEKANKEEKCCDNDSEEGCGKHGAGKGKNCKHKDAPIDKEEESAKQSYLRLMADFQNFKKRVEKEKADIFNFANEKIMVEMLSVLDNFERAMEQGCEDEKFISGIDMVLKQYTQVLSAAGLEEIQSTGETFDPNFHNAIMMEEKEGVQSGEVTETLQKGYTLKGKVIRPSMVKVSK